MTNDTSRNLTLTTTHKTNIEFIMDNSKTLKQIEEYLKNQKNGKNEDDKQNSFVALNPSQINTTGAEVILDTVEPTDFDIVYYDQLSTQKKYSTSLQRNL